MWQLTAHYRDILEGHLISAARTRNSLQYILQSSVRKSDVADFVLSLQEREQMHSKKLAGKGVQNGPVSGSAEVAAAEGPLGGSKRKLADFLSAPATADSLAGARASASESNFGDNSVSTSTAVAAFADTAADDSTASMSSAQEEISWAAVLQHLEAEYNLVPKVKYIPHVPLMQVNALFCSTILICVLPVSMALRISINVSGLQNSSIYSRSDWHKNVLLLHTSISLYYIMFINVY